MILLTGSSTLRVYLGAPVSTNELPIVATYVDSNSSNFTPQAAETTTNGTNPVTVVYAPVSGLSRQIKYLSVLNTDTVTSEVFIDYHTPSNDRRLFKQALTPNQKIEFLDTEGFEVIPASFLTVTGNVTGLPFITYQSSPLLYNHRVSAARSGIQIIDEGTNAGSYSFGLSGSMYQDITGHTGDLTQHITGLSISNQLLDQTLVWNTTGWINKYPHSVVYATNAEATTLDIGEVVYLSGAQGDRASVRRASNLYENTSSKTVGVVSFPIASSQAGAVVTLGYVEKLNLGSYSPGDVLWLGDTPGTFTSTKPTSPNHLVFVGVVARANAGNGIAFIRTQNGYELEELHDVRISTPGLVSGQFLKYTTGIWQNTGIFTGDVSGFTTGVKYAIGSSGFFEYRGGLTGQWDPTTAKLTLNLYSGAGAGGATQLADLTDVSDVLSPINGHILYYNTEWTSLMANENFVLALAPSPTGTNLVGNIALTGTGGIDIWANYSSNRIIVSGQKTSISASLTGLGVAGFNATNFAVSNGIVSITGGIQTGQIVGYGVTTGQISNLVEATQDTIATSLATTSGLAVVYDDINGTIIISGQRATTVNPGLAIFSATNFTVSSGMALITGGLQTGYVVGLVPAIQNTVGSSIGLINLTGVLASGSISGDYLVFNGTGWTGSPTIKQILNATKTPNGYENRAESTLAFDEGTRTFSITPVGASFSFWNSGKRYTKTTAQTKVIPDASGLYYFYFDAGGDLQYKNIYFDFANDVHTSYVYWNPDHNRAYYFADERHGVTMDWQTHLYLHRTRGAAYANGFGASNYTLIGAGTSDSDCQIDIANGSFFDEDIEVAITHSATPAANSWEQVLQGPAEIPMFYLSGAGLWIKDTATQFPVKQGTHTAQYNIFSGAIWTGVDLSGVAPNQTGYGITWIIATNNLNSPILGILGQSFYTGLGAAEAANWTDVTLPGFPIYEFRPLYKLIYEAYSGFTNTPRARFRSLIDLRLTQSVAGGTPATPVSDHGSLVGLADDDHTQYTRADGTRAFTSVIAGVDPVGLSDLATRNFVENRTQWASTAVSGISWYDGNFFTVTDGYVSLNALYITDLSDTAVTAPVSGQTFVFDGFVWRNSGLTTGNITLLAEAIRDEAGAAIVAISGISKDVQDGNDVIRISGNKATTSTPGIAAFSPTYFSVTDALVTITGGIQGSQVSNLTINTGQITNLIEAIVDETYLALRTTSGISVVYNDTAGTITLSGERANYSDIGLAAFNSAQFTVNSGHVSVISATDTVAGIIEIATNAETASAAATNRALVPSNISSIKTSVINNDAGFITTLSVDGLSDAIVTAGSSGQVLAFDGINWRNSGLTTGNIALLGECIRDEASSAITGISGIIRDYNDAGDSIRLSGVKATTTTPGIAAFSPTYFAVTDALVEITGGIQGSQVSNLTITTGQITSLVEAIVDETYLALRSTSGLSILYNDGAGTITLSGERANYNEIGLAAFNSSHFIVNSGHVSLASVGGASALDDLTDVTIAVPLSGQVLFYDGFRSLWVNTGLTTGNISNLVEAIQDTIGTSLATTSGLAIIYSDTDNQIIISGQRASTTSTFTGIGLAGFSATHFQLSSGVVSITGGIQTGHIINLIEAIVDETYLALRTSSGLSITYADNSGAIIFSGERAAYNQIGLAAFNSSHFTVNSGHVSLTTPVVPASESVAGIIEIATNTEAADATSNNVALVPSNLSSIKTSALNNDAGFLVDITAGLLNDLSDVTEVSPVSTQFLMRGTGIWTNSYVPTGSVTNLRTAVKNEIGTSGEFFLYRGGLTGIWDNTNKILTLSVMSGSWPGAGGASNLDSLTDVTISAASAGQYLAYDGTNWINSGIQSGRASWNASGLQGKPIQSLSTVAFGDMLLYSYPAGDGWTNYPATDFAKIAIFNATGLNSLPVTFGAAPITGQVLAHNGDRWVNSDILTGNIVNLRNAIKDEIGASGQFFRYRGGITGYWDGATETLTLDYFSGASAGAGNLDSLTDVVITTPSSGQVVQYNGTNWVNTNSWNIKIKPTRESRALTSVAATDSDLWVPLAANTNYMFRGKVFYITEATPDFKYGFTGTTGSEWWVQRRNILPEASGISTAAVEHYPWGQAFNPGMGGIAGTKIVAAAGNSGAGFVEFDAVVLNSGNTGIFGFMWAQNTSNSLATTVNQGSYIEWRVFT